MLKQLADLKYNQENYFDFLSINNKKLKSKNLLDFHRKIYLLIIYLLSFVVFKVN